MRHFIWYDSTGTIRGVHRHSGGWPTHEDLRDGQSTSPKVVSIRTRMAAEEDFEGFAEFNCMCPSAAFMCSCAYEIMHSHYVAGSTVTAKPTLLVEVDGQAVKCGHVFNNTFVDLTPGSTVNLVLRAAVPDGHSVAVSNSTSHIALVTPTSLTFTDGVSDALPIQVPDQGLFGIVGGHSNLIQRFAVAVRGWA